MIPILFLKAEYKEKFSGFDDDTLSYMCKLENKKLEDARIPPLIVRNETIMLKNNLSREVYNGAEETTNSIAKCDSDCEGNTGRFETQEKEEERRVKKNHHLNHAVLLMSHAIHNPINFPYILPPSQVS